MNDVEPAGRSDSGLGQVHIRARRDWLAHCLDANTALVTMLAPPRPPGRSALMRADAVGLPSATVDLETYRHRSR